MVIKRALLVINPKSNKAEQNRNNAESALLNQDLEIEKVFPQDPEDMRTKIREKAGNTDCVIVGGGDGTLNAAVEALLETRSVLGILPLGTANDLVRTLGIPADIEHAAHIIASGNRSRIDLGWVNGKYFFNVANIGLAVKVKETLTHERKQRWGVMAYPLGIFDAVKSYRPFKAIISCNGNSQKVRSIQIAVGNGRHYGGGMTIKADASIQDHILNLYSLRPQRLLQLMFWLPALRTGVYPDTDKIWLMQSDDLRIQTRKPKKISIDGEFCCHTPAHFKVMRNALPVLVP